MFMSMYVCMYVCMHVCMCMYAMLPTFLNESDKLELKDDCMCGSLLLLSSVCMVFVLLFVLACALSLSFRSGRRSLGGLEKDDQ
jgi:hypothetical protein